MIEVGLSYTTETVVTDSLTALAMGSGDLPVFATPAMLALMENAAMSAVKDYLQDGFTTVGGRIESSHLKPSGVGETVRATAEVTQVEGKKIYFHVAAYMDDTLIGEGTHLRFIVNKAQFLAGIK